MGKPLLVQLLRTGAPLPEIVDTVPIEVPAADRPVVSFTRDLDRADGTWVVLRITDPEGEPDGRATGAYAEAGRGIAYTSPFHLVADRGPAGVGGVPVSVPGQDALAGSSTGPGATSTLPATGTSTPLLGTGAALGAAAIAALAARRAAVRDEHHHDHH